MASENCVPPFIIAELELLLSETDRHVEGLDHRSSNHHWGHLKQRSLESGHVAHAFR